MDEFSNEGMHLHHTISKLLQDPNSIHAFLTFQSTFQILTAEGLGEDLVSESAFLLLCFVAFQKEGKVGASRYSFEKTLRKLHNLIRPTNSGAEVIPLHPDLYDGLPF